MISDINKFRKCLQFVLNEEGGYVNDPNDPGKETKWGISKKAYPHLDIKNLTPEIALEIYRVDYWDKMGCENLTTPTALAVFDSAVACGPGRVKFWLNNLGTNVKIESKEGIDALLRLRGNHYYGLAENTSWGKNYLKGWLNRLSRLKREIDLIRQKD